jgi:thioredoxin:protein disulfide reductase
MKLIRLSALCLIALTASSLAQAKPWWMRGVESNESDFLPPNVAFRLGANVEGNTVNVRWVIADGYYLYKSKIQIVAESPDLIVAAPQLPPGVVKTDQYMGTQEIYTQQVEVPARFTRTDAGAHPIQIKVTYQGCADAGLCYPPLTRVVFPTVGSAPDNASGDAQPWEILAICLGAFAFLIAGFTLRKDRRLETPAQ